MSADRTSGRLHGWPEPTPTSLSVGLESEATNIVSYGFTLPNGDMLFTLWTNGAAVDDDPGVAANLRFTKITSP